MIIVIICTISDIKCYEITANNTKSKNLPTPTQYEMSNSKLICLVIHVEMWL